MSRLLVVHPRRPSRVDLAQLAPLRRHCAALQLGSGLRLEFAEAESCPELHEAVRRAAPELVWIQARSLVREPRAKILDLLSAIRADGTRVAWLDAQASSTREDFWLAPHVDLYVRRSLLRRPEHHGGTFLQGRLHAEAVRRRFDPRSVRRLAAGFGTLRGPRPAWRLWQLARLWRSGIAPGAQRFAGWPLPSTGSVALGWNLALADDLVALAAEAPDPGRKRDIDLHCRVRAAFPLVPAWYVCDRLGAVRAAERLVGFWRVVTSSDHLDRRRYLDEMRRSRLVVSPFGWGEVCFRDFEAILSGAVLVKPSMRHLETWPDVYRPHETYVPVRWDWSDLEVACRPYLEDESARRDLAERARQALVQSFAEAPFRACCEALVATQTGRRV